MCSTSCGKGSKIRARTCSGEIGTCLAESTETKDCQENKCPGCLFCSFLFLTSLQDLSSQVNGKNGGPGPTAQQHVARGTESGLELAVEVMVLVQESQERPKIAF